MPVQITSLSNPQSKKITAGQKKSKPRAAQGVFVTEGMKMVREMPPGWLYQAYVSESFEKGRFWQEVRQACSPVVVSDHVFAAMSDTCAPQGILALVRQPSLSLEQLTGSSSCPFFLLLENLQDPGNLGTILRTAEAAGCSGVIMSRDTVDIYNPKVIRSTMGAIYRVPFFYPEDFGETVRMLKTKGFSIFAAHLKGSVPFDQPDYTGPCACMIGNEGNGLTEAAASLADCRIRIPMEGQAESLNAAVSAALILYEAYRQKRQGVDRKY